MHPDHLWGGGLREAEAGPGGDDVDVHAGDDPAEQHQGGDRHPDEQVAQEAQRRRRPERAAGPLRDHVQELRDSRRTGTNRLQYECTVVVRVFYA